MEIWETNAAILGSEKELELQADGWEPFGAVYDWPPINAGSSERWWFTKVLYRRKKEGLGGEE